MRIPLKDLREKQLLRQTIRYMQSQIEQLYWMLNNNQPEPTDASGLTLSNEIPLVESGSGSAGDGNQAARWNHVHPEFGGGLTIKTYTQFPAIPLTSSIISCKGQLWFAIAGDTHWHPMGIFTSQTGVPGT